MISPLTPFSFASDFLKSEEIAKFDAAVNKKKSIGAIRTTPRIKKYMKVLDDKFKLRYKILF